MDISRDLRPADASVRKRATDAAAVRTSTGSSRASGSAGQAGAVNQNSGLDQVSFGDVGAIDRYVAVLKTMNPVNLHKVEDLRARIADGSYTADPEELANLLLADHREPPAGRRSV